MSKDKNMEKNSMKVEQKTRWHEEDLPSLIEEIWRGVCNTMQGFGH